MRALGQRRHKLTFGRREPGGRASVPARLLLAPWNGSLREDVRHREDGGELIGAEWRRCLVLGAVPPGPYRGQDRHGGAPPRLGLVLGHHYREADRVP